MHIVAAVSVSYTALDIRGMKMPQPVLTHSHEANSSKTKQSATFQDVKSAAKTGDAIFAFYTKHGRFPKDASELKLSK